MACSANRSDQAGIADGESRHSVNDPPHPTGALPEEDVRRWSDLLWTEICNEKKAKEVLRVVPTLVEVTGMPTLLIKKLDWVIPYSLDA